jgi:redox-sensitive bicupin YhaK (pirin superfamily)
MTDIELALVPRTVDIGGFSVHRALPSQQQRMVGPFIFWDQMGAGAFAAGHGVDVRPHPHIGLSTVTYLFEGTLDHKDSLGNGVRIVPGEVNLMSAGKGIVHSERTGADIRRQPSRLFGIQSWLAQPKDSILS